MITFVTHHRKVNHFTLFHPQRISVQYQTITREIRHKLWLHQNSGGKQTGNLRQTFCWRHLLRSDVTIQSTGYGNTYHNKVDYADQVFFAESRPLNVNKYAYTSCMFTTASPFSFAQTKRQQNKTNDWDNSEINHHVWCD